MLCFCLDTQPWPPRGLLTSSSPEEEAPKGLFLDVPRLLFPVGEKYWVFISNWIFLLGKGSEPMASFLLLKEI
jgi:hypothetical protein